MSEEMTREKVLELLVTRPAELIRLFGISREEFMEGLWGRCLEGLKEELGGSLGDLFPLDQHQAGFISGLGRQSLLSNEHIDGGGRGAKRWTVRQALDARDKRTVNKAPDLPESNGKERSA